MLREMYMVNVSKKETPKEVHTFFMTDKLYDQIINKNGFNIYGIRVNIYGVPADVKLMTIPEAEHFFNFRFVY